MSKGNSRRAARDHKYAEVSMSHTKTMVGIHGWHREVFPELKATRHGKAPEKIEREDEWR